QDGLGNIHEAPPETLSQEIPPSTLLVNTRHFPISPTPKCLVVRNGIKKPHRFLRMGSANATPAVTLKSRRCFGEGNSNAFFPDTAHAVVCARSRDARVCGT